MLNNSATILFRSRKTLLISVLPIHWRNMFAGLRHRHHFIFIKLLKQIKCLLLIEKRFLIFIKDFVFYLSGNVRRCWNQLKSLFFAQASFPLHSISILWNNKVFIYEVIVLWILKLLCLCSQLLLIHLVILFLNLFQSM
jgi:hypothetical protein